MIENKDKIGFLVSEVCAISTAKYGFVIFKDGEFVLDKKRWKEHCSFLRSEGANGVRFLAWANFTQKDPEKIITGYIYSKNLKKADLKKWNLKYFIIVREMSEIANAQNLIVYFDLFDNCQFFRGNYSPWNQNRQGLSSYMGSDKYAKLWIAKMVNTLKGLTIRWNLGNELEPKIGMKTSRIWALNMISYMHTDMKIPFSHMGYGAVMKEAPYIEGKFIPGKMSFQDWIKGDIDRKFGEQAKLEIWKSVHAVGNLLSPVFPVGKMIAQALQWWGKNPICVELTGDGCFRSDSKCDVNLNAPIPERRASAETWGRILDEIFKYPIRKQRVGYRFRIEWLPAAWEDKKCLKKTFKVIRDKYRKKFGKDFENYGKFPEPEIIPEPEPPKPEPVEPIEPKPKKEVNMWQKIKNASKFIWRVITEMKFPKWLKIVSVLSICFFLVWLLIQIF